MASKTVPAPISLVAATTAYEMIDNHLDRMLALAITISNELESLVKSDVPADTAWRLSEIMQRMAGDQETLGTLRHLLGMEDLHGRALIAEARHGA